MELQDLLRMYPIAFSPKDGQIPIETGVACKTICRFLSSETMA